MNIILKTTTKLVGGLKLYSVDKVNDVDLKEFKFVKEIDFKTYRVFQYINESTALEKGNSIQLDVFQLKVDTKLKRVFNSIKNYFTDFGFNSK